jgi:hypothetical protein
MCEGRRLCESGQLVELGRGIRGLDVSRFAVDLASDAMLERFSDDLDRRRALGGDRALPFVEIDGGGEPRDVSDLDALVRAAGAEPSAAAAPSVEAALARFGRMATPEVAAVCELPGPLAAAELWRLAAGWRVRALPCLSGELWELV